MRGHLNCHICRTSVGLLLFLAPILVERADAFTTLRSAKTSDALFGRQSSVLDAMQNGDSKATFDEDALHISAPPANQINRREAMALSIAAASALLLSTAPQSAAYAQEAPAEPLEEMGSWSMKANPSGDAMVSQLSIDSGGARFVPPAFAVYVARFLLRYDGGASSWWSSERAKYSLLSDAERQAKLDDSFGRFAKSVSVGIESYLQGSSDTFDVDPKLPGGTDGPRSMVRTKREGVSLSVRDKYSQIANTFALRYTSNNVSGEEGREISRQLALMFSMLPPQYQPLSVMEQLVQVSSAGRKDSPVVLPRDMNKKPKVLGVPDSVTAEYDALLPSIYDAIPFVTSSAPDATVAYTISPPISLFAVRGVKSAVATTFGPLASVPLSRDKTADLKTYFLYGVSGGSGCALTHSVSHDFSLIVEMPILV